MSKKTALIIDANNILYRTFFAQVDDPEDIIIGMAHHSALTTLLKYWKSYSADEIVLAFDYGSWRKMYTEDLSQCVTYKKYKGQRRVGLTEKQSAKLAKFDEHIKEFAQIMETQTSLLVLRCQALEADDMIAGYVQNNPDMRHVIVSSDKDFMQLLVKHDVALIDPASGKPRSLSEYDNDPDYFMFSKCLRGDTSDNVISAFPRIRQTKIKQAYLDDYTKQAVMQNTFTVIVNVDDGVVKEETFKTETVFEENDLLMNLESQPECIKELIVQAIENARKNRGKFNYLKFLRFCSDYELVNILNRIDNYVPMLAGKKTLF